MIVSIDWSRQHIAVFILIPFVDRQLIDELRQIVVDHNVQLLQPLYAEIDTVFSLFRGYRCYAVLS